MTFDVQCVPTFDVIELKFKANSKERPLTKNLRQIQMKGLSTELERRIKKKGL